MIHKKVHVLIALQIAIKLWIIFGTDLIAHSHHFSEPVGAAGPPLEPPAPRLRPRRLVAQLARRRPTLPLRAHTINKNI